MFSRPRNTTKTRHSSSLGATLLARKDFSWRQPKCYSKRYHPCICFVHMLQSFKASLEDLQLNVDRFTIHFAALAWRPLLAQRGYAFLQIYVSRAKRKVLEALELPRDYRTLLTENDLQATIQAVRLLRPKSANYQDT